MKKSCGINSITNAKRYREVYKVAQYLGMHIREFTDRFAIYLLTDDMVTDLYRQCLLQYNTYGELDGDFVLNTMNVMIGV